MLPLLLRCFSCTDDHAIGTSCGTRVVSFSLFCYFRAVLLLIQPELLCWCRRNLCCHVRVCFKRLRLRLRSHPTLLFLTAFAITIAVSPCLGPFVLLIGQPCSTILQQHAFCLAFVNSLGRLTPYFRWRVGFVGRLCPFSGLLGASRFCQAV